MCVVWHVCAAHVAAGFRLVHTIVVQLNHRKNEVCTRCMHTFIPLIMLTNHLLTESAAVSHWPQHCKIIQLLPCIYIIRTHY